MNANSFNALLKALEEPSDESLLVLTTARLESVPVTVASRCQRLRLPAPPRSEALAWLGAREAGRDWSLALELAGGVPQRALRLASEGIEELYEEVVGTLGRGALDVVAVARRWSDDRAVERLGCLDDWLTTCARQAFRSDAVNNSRRAPLPSSVRLPDSAILVRLIHATRETRARVDGRSRISYNVQLLLEALLVRLQSAFG
jgi:DNA polymerase-3 subunit delta'